VALAVLGYAASPAGAQTTPNGAPATAGGQVGFSIQLNGTPQQQMAEADAVIAFIEQSSQMVGRKLQAARLAHDVVKTLCLNDKMSQIDVAKSSAHERKTSLAAAAGHNDRDLASHQSTLLSVHKQRVQQLMTEANQCIGEEQSYTGGTTTLVVVDSDIPPDQVPGWFPPILPGNIPVVGGPGGISVLPPGTVSPTK